MPSCVSQFFHPWHLAHPSHPFAFAWLDGLRVAAAWAVRSGCEACLIVAGVLLVQRLLRGRVSARWRYNLWLLVVARLLLPAVPGSQYSPFNLVQVPQTEVLQTAPAARPAPRTAPQFNPGAPLPATPVPVPALRPDRNL